MFRLTQYMAALRMAMPSDRAGFVRHSRAGGNPAAARLAYSTKLGSRPRGNDGGLLGLAYRHTDATPRRPSIPPQCHRRARAL